MQVNRTTRKSPSSSDPPETTPPAGSGFVLSDSQDIVPKECALCGYRYADPDYKWLCDTKGRRFCSMTCMDKQAVVERGRPKVTVEKATFTNDSGRYEFERIGKSVP